MKDEPYFAALQLDLSIFPVVFVHHDGSKCTGRADEVHAALREEGYTMDGGAGWDEFQR